MTAGTTPSVALELPPLPVGHWGYGYATTTLIAYAQRAVEEATRELRSRFEACSLELVDADEEIGRLRSEAAALRRELETLRKASLATYASIDEEGRKEPEMAALTRTLLTLLTHGSPAPSAAGLAREGLSPLTEGEIVRLLLKLNCAIVDSASPTDMFTIIVREVEAAHGIAAPAGTSEGEKV